MIGYIILVLIICIALFFCCVDANGSTSSKVLLVLMFIIMAFTTENVDMGAYIGWYRYIDSIWKVGVTDPGFGFLMYLGRAWGLDYQGFVIALTVLGLSFVTIVLYKKSDCPAIVLAMYFALVFTTLTIQIRAFLAETVLYILITEIVEHDKFNIKKYSLLMIAAVMLHASSFFYILLLLMAIVKNQRKLEVIVAAAIAAVPFTAVFLRYVPIPMIQRKVAYFAHRTSLFSSVYLYVLLYLVVTITVYYLYASADTSEWKNKLRRLFQVNTICLVACAMIVAFSPNFYRMIRVVMIADTIVVTNYLYETGNLRLKNRAVYSALIIGLFIVGNILTGVLLDICTNNEVLGALLELNS